MKKALKFFILVVVIILVLVILLVQNKSEENKNHFSFLCSNGGEISIDYKNEDKTSLTLNVPGADFTLNNSISASGARFVNTDESVVFWEKGGEAFVQIDGETLYQECALFKDDKAVQQYSKDREKDFGLNMEIFNELLVENKWQWTETLYSNDGVVKPKNPDDFIIIFNNNGEFSANTDCNTLMGKFTLGANFISFQQIASTLKACPNGSQEQDFLNMLNEVEKFWLTPDGALALTLSHNSGSMIFIPAE